MAITSAPYRNDKRKITSRMNGQGASPNEMRCRSPGWMASGCMMSVSLQLAIGGLAGCLRHRRLEFGMPAARAAEVLWVTRLNEAAMHTSEEPGLRARPSLQFLIPVRQNGQAREGRPLAEDREL